MSSVDREQRFRKLQEQYLAETRVQIVRWSERLAKGEALTKAEHAELSRMIHNLKGSGSGYRFEALTEQAAKIEDALVPGIASAALAKLIGELLWLHRGLCEDLENR